MFNWHYRLERHTLNFAFALMIVVSIGGLIEIAPLFTIRETVEKAPDMRLYTPLELAGREIYIREGCYACHSQMVRTLRDEVDRYGPYSLAAESQYDHPMLWGSKRTGPDIARLGGKYSDEWHLRHLVNPRAVVPGSLMPRYPWLLETPLDTSLLERHLLAQQRVGVPYDEAMIRHAAADAIGQAMPDSLQAEGVSTRYGKATQSRAFDGKPHDVTEMDALIAYLQILGRLTTLPEKTGLGRPVAQREAAR